MIKFSALILVYNKEKPEYFYEALNSLIKQTRKPSEIVIVKDGRLTEKLENVITKFLDETKGVKVKMISLGENIGSGGASAIGVKACSYEYIARLDSDDIANENRFELQAELFEKEPMLDIVSGYIEEFSEAMDGRTHIRKVPVTGKEISQYIKYKSPFNHSAVMYKKSSIIRIGNYNALRKMEDYDLWIRAVKNNLKCYNIPEILTRVRIGNNTYKKRGGIKYICTIVNIQNKLKDNDMITIKEEMKNIFFRTVVALMPWKLRRCVYWKFLREI